MEGSSCRSSSTARAERSTASTSAYNNAGFSLWPNSLESYRSNAVVNAVVMLLIVMGGLGWRVTSDIAQQLIQQLIRRNRRRLSLHTRLVLRTTLILVILGTIGLALTEWLNKGENFLTLSWSERWLTALFQSVTARTAGFNTVPFTVESITESGVLLVMTLMFIGASPGGTGGGIKTTTVAALMAVTRSTLRGRDSVVIRNREIKDSEKVIGRAVGITVASLLFVLAMALLISVASNFHGRDDFTFLAMLFTCISAFATVGLDMGVTTELGHFGQAVLLVGMFVGRLGILLLLTAIWDALTREQNHIHRQNRIGYPREDLYV